LISQLGPPVSPEPAVATPSTNNISISRLPTTGAKLFGREKELSFLDEAWEEKHTAIVSLIAWGGVGKTSLVNEWLNLMGKKDYKEAKKVYGWSFYSQGAAEGKQSSADEFIRETLKWFGDVNPDEGSGVDKGRRLAALVKKEKTLLILDGMEPLQFPPGKVEGLAGKLKDDGLRAMLKELAAGQPGVCVISSRLPVTDLENNKGHGMKEIQLEDLSIEAGAALLRDMGIDGLETEMEAAVTEYHGHALALTLLGKYLKGAYKGDIRERDRIPSLFKEPEKGGHARRVLKAYENQFKTYPKWKFLRRFKWFVHAKPQLDILRLMGLFDRPVEKEALEALKADPPIPGVTEHLQPSQLSGEDWQWAVSDLREQHLLAEENPAKPGGLDCHPLVREHFGESVKNQNPIGWQQAHQRLYEFYKSEAKQLPDTLKEMEPLFAAVAHGCMAGKHQETLLEVYHKRIKRGEDNYSTAKL
ncbi:MAG: ATP-binding protein, partial [bacterium]|nr:ATP-binding protein [bacterium]